ncbi:NAD-dependent epimerase/dehydratase family protein [Streptomyces sp. NPDC001568]|uniref:NAD-dependent epimerase/dehydratase family protein n=1 Tax=Streptomyces sp. NPDC001568 TaxID=3364588 RepID=UPI0036B39C0D
MDRMLVIGGSRYFGKHLVTLLRDAGNEVTVLNRGSALPPEGVGRLVADRDDERQLRAALGSRTFDAVVDQVCYTPRQAAVARRVFGGGRTGRYVMTSTMEVYDPATFPGPDPNGGSARPPSAPAPSAPAAVVEESIDRLISSPVLPTAAGADVPPGPAAGYAEGKRRAEAVFLNDPAFPYVSVRAAHVLGGGRAEFTGRLAHYVGRIGAGLPVEVHEHPYPTSFIHHREIAEFLAWTVAGSFTGPVNASSEGALTVTRLCELVAARAGRPARYRTVPRGREASPFSFDRPYALDNGRAARLGFAFTRTEDWLPAAIDEAVADTAEATATTTC